jgi:hypothetical protein
MSETNKKPLRFLAICCSTFCTSLRGELCPLNLALRRRKAGISRTFSSMKISRRRGAAVRIGALRGHMARIFRIGVCRPPFGVAGCWEGRRTL